MVTGDSLRSRPRRSTSARVPGEELSPSMRPPSFSISTLKRPRHVPVGEVDLPPLQGDLADMHLRLGGGAGRFVTLSRQPAA